MATELLQGLLSRGLAWCQAALHHTNIAAGHAASLTSPPQAHQSTERLSPVDPPVSCRGWEYVGMNPPPKYLPLIPPPTPPLVPPMAWVPRGRGMDIRLAGLYWDITSEMGPPRENAGCVEIFFWFLWENGESSV